MDQVARAPSHAEYVGRPHARCGTARVHFDSPSSDLSQRGGAECTVGTAIGGTPCRYLLRCIPPCAFLMSCPVLTLDATPGAAPHSSIHPHFMHSGSDDSLRNSRPEASMLSSPNGLRSSKLANSWRSWRLDVTDDKNEVLRLRSFLCEAEVAHHPSTPALAIHGRC